MLVIALFLGANIWAQNEPKEIDTVIISGNQKTTKYTDGSQYIEIIKQPTYSTTKTQKKFESKQQELAYLRKYINDLETKIKHVKSNPDEDQLAKKQGWYDEMNGYISQSKARIKEIEKLLESKEK